LPIVLFVANVVNSPVEPFDAASLKLPRKRRLYVIVILGKRCNCVGWNGKFRREDQGGDGIGNSYCSRAEKAVTDR
jgi:hypothetical protein